jgi:hypothetical protein
MQQQQQQQQQDQPTSHLVRLLAATWPPTRLLVCFQTPTALLAPRANSGTTTGGGAFAAGRTLCRAAVIAKGVRRSKQYIARKELQKRAKEEYLRRIYEVNPSTPLPPNVTTAAVVMHSQQAPLTWDAWQSIISKSLTISAHIASASSSLGPCSNVAMKPSALPAPTPPTPHTVTLPPPDADSRPCGG